MSARGQRDTLGAILTKEEAMAHGLRMMPSRIAGFAVRQPRVALGSAGLGAVLLVELLAHFVAV